MATKRTKAPAVPAAPQVSETDRDMLVGAYRSGLISSWKRDSDQVYRLTLGPKGEDAYVEVAKLTRYLDDLRKKTA